MVGMVVSYGKGVAMVRVAEVMEEEVVVALVQEVMALEAAVRAVAVEVVTALVKVVEALLAE